MANSQPKARHRMITFVAIIAVIAAFLAITYVVVFLPGAEVNQGTTTVQQTP